jgi:hypothetical protein
MRSALAEVLVGLPHLVAIDRLPASVSADGVTVELTGEQHAVDVIGDLRAHVSEARWRQGRRTGPARYEVVRSHVDRCALTLVLDGVDLAAAYHLALAARRQMLAAPAPRASTTTAAGTVAARPATLPA